MGPFFKNFYHEDDGAVTVDWVVITAGIVIFAASLGVYLRDATIEKGELVGQSIAEVEF